MKKKMSVLLKLREKLKEFINIELLKLRFTTVGSISVEKFQYYFIMCRLYLYYYWPVSFRIENIISTNNLLCISFQIIFDQHFIWVDLIALFMFLLDMNRAIFKESIMCTAHTHIIILSVSTLIYRNWNEAMHKPVSHNEQKNI